MIAAGTKVVYNLDPEWFGSDTKEKLNGNAVVIDWPADQAYLRENIWGRQYFIRDTDDPFSKAFLVFAHEITPL